MSKEYSFNVMPSVSISRSRFARKSQHKTSFNMGQIVPVYVDEVLPGDTRSLDMASLVRMSTPIAPIMDNIYLDFFAFFVPNRLVWDHWKEFQGENNASAGIPQMTYSIPYVYNDDGFTTPYVHSLAAYMGIPNGTKIFDNDDQKWGLKVSALPFRALAKIYNRWFRNENIIAPLAVQTDDTDEVLVGEKSSGSPNFAFGNNILFASKLPDYFTMCLPYAQKGAAVTIPIGTTAPIIGTISEPSSGWPAASTDFDLKVSSPASTTNKQATGFGYDSSGYSIQLSADLSNATAATINQLRYAFQLQKLLEKDALYGTRYWEILAAHFGITAPDASLQDPEYLGGKRMNVNIDQVLSTAGYDPSTNTEVGQPGANSVTPFKGSIFTKSFTEHGYLFILAVARHDQTYAQGVNRMWTRKTRYDFYMPVFANLGAQAVKAYEIDATHATDAASLENVFGYQEYAADYRYKPSICSGLLNPNVTGSLRFWTLASRFINTPTLSKTFIEQDRQGLIDALVTGTNGPDFVADFFFRDIAVRPMPVYSIPGLIDHH